MAALNLDRTSLSKEFKQMPIPEALLERSAAFNYDTDAVPMLMDSLQSKIIESCLNFFK